MLTVAVPMIECPAWSKTIYVIDGIPGTPYAKAKYHGSLRSSWPESYPKKKTRSTLIAMQKSCAHDVSR